MRGGARRSGDGRLYVGEVGQGTHHTREHAAKQPQDEEGRPGQANEGGIDEQGELECVVGRRAWLCRSTARDELFWTDLPSRCRQGTKVRVLRTKKATLRESRALLIWEGRAKLGPARRCWLGWRDKLSGQVDEGMASEAAGREAKAK